ncbi:Scr1 family TA system antitoxin-like transcriptional regulator [Solwaraspora sp. WMMA2080]|uniref:Scr1 family TA system antitoxin-like transcriptional regulator n=1 Tax=Solwaraspora sp. WMMA2080 TaxID=3015165 RepID=UPI0032B1057C
MRSTYQQCSTTRQRANLPAITGSRHPRNLNVETLADAAYLDGPDAVRAYTRLWEGLTAAALGPVESRALIQRIADDTGG